MRQKLAATILATVGLIAQENITFAQVSPPLQSQELQGHWSQVINTQGKSCVADHHDQPIDFQSTWCSDFIGLEAVKHWQEKTGTRWVTKFKKVPRTNRHEEQDRRDRHSHHRQRNTDYQTISYTAEEPIYTSFTKKYNIQEIQFDAGKYVYRGGEVPLELKEFLSSLPEKNIWVHLITTEGENWDYEIGKNTVKAWKQIYSINNILPKAN
ncbi:hypothetical protein [Nostoc sp. MS1]|uniref:hypothetical protein n=1 Tax=Nostoc sp. MS1 TaxID=2764711 RepID=UPI001CC6FE2C|nr:hypothetical protein [Nostoc sp. MS1]BCL33963.1 hypothetical protein NSMS1_04100 [Nostoc sp. MS1]